MSNPTFSPVPPQRRGTASVKWDLSRHQDMLPMWVADMDFPCDPSIQAAMVERIEHGIFGYTFADEEFFQVFRDWAKETQNWTIGEGHQLYAPGMMPAIRELILGLTEPGQGVVVQPPVYNPFYSVVTQNHRRLVENPLVLQNNSYSMDFDGLARVTADPDTAMVLLCSPHNPVGRVWTEQELCTLRDICQENRVILVVDEIHGDLILPGNSFYASGRLAWDSVISIQSPGKTFNIPSVNSAQVVIPNDDLRKKAQIAFDIGGFEIVNPLSVAAAKAGYTHGRQWLNHILGQVARNLDLFDELVAQAEVPMKRMESQGTYLAWVDISEMQKNLGLNTREVQQELRQKARLWVSPGTQFGQDGGNGFLRFNLGCPEEHVREAVRRIVCWWNNRD